MDASEDTGEVCNICASDDLEIVFDGSGGRGITSLARVISDGPIVRLCRNCGLLQSQPLDDLAAYYDTAYRISVESVEDDQLYGLVDGSPVYRSEHQHEVLRRMVDLPTGAKVLDFGSGKAPTVRLLAEDRLDVQVHVFDVSRDYVSLWEQFLTEDRWACYELPAGWRGRFDVVTSFFSLEHTVAPVEFVRTAASLLAPRGVFYAVVPNPYGGNASDVLVVDHVNHFSPRSLEHLLAVAGLELVSLDAESHDLAYVLVARRSSTPAAPPGPATESELAVARSTCDYWKEATVAVQAFEADHPGPAALYGAGIVGAFILSALRDPSHVVSVVDRNVHKQGTDFDGHPVIAVESLRLDTVAALYVGLNPGRGRAAIEAIEGWQGHDGPIFHLPDV